ncbi:MAG: hypothetical protein KAI33_02180, partial [Elusimicrobiales bacterium]|nr:hypothetical protein [Elusimicrobiales bacterium]
NGKLYAGVSSNSKGYILVFDGTSWTESYDGEIRYLHSLVVYNGKLYAAQAGTTAGDGDIYVCEPGADGVCSETGEWSKSYDGALRYIVSLGVYNGQLYAGQGGSEGEGDILVCNPETAGDSGVCDDNADWSKTYDGAQEYIYSIAAFNGKLYAGQGYSFGDGDVFEFTPVAVSSMTGIDGTTSEQTLYALAEDFAASTNSETCGGSYSCGATNQMVFSITDRAGNVNMSGPYAVITAPNIPNVDDVIGRKSTGSWYNTNAFIYTSTTNFDGVGYYLYEWNTSATHSWTENEPAWNSGELSFDAVESNRYLHILPYNVAESSDTGRHLGPYGFDVTLPIATVSSFRSISSTDGAMAESQFNDLTSGVTVQISVQDVLAGLVVSSTMTPGEAIAAPGGFGAIYSKDAGQTWSVEDMSISYDGAENIIYSLVVYNDRLYAGQGNGNGYVYVSSNGINWSTSFEGAQEYIHSLAVFNGKLYAGESGNTAGDGDIYVCNPETAGDSTEVCDHADDWTKSFDGDQEEILSIASYAGKLYAGQGRQAGDGDIYVCDPGANGVCDLGEWTKSFEGGAYKIHSLAVYNSGFYAGQGKTDSTLGDIYVSTDGINWNISHNGDKHGFYSLAVYNDKLYAGQGNDYNYDSGGAGDIYVFDGTNWELSYDGENSKILSLAVFNGQLYAGEHGPHSNHPAYTGDIMSFDGTSWSQNYEGEQEIISSLATFNGNLYAGQGDDTDEGDVLKFTPTVVSTMTGTD